MRRQAHLLAVGASKTAHSRHLTGHALDIIPYYDWDGDGKKDLWHWPLYHEIAAVGKQVAENLDIDIIWGGSWHSFPDGPHWELPKADYPQDQKWRDDTHHIGPYGFEPFTEQGKKGFLTNPLLSNIC